MKHTLGIVLTCGLVAGCATDLRVPSVDSGVWGVNRYSPESVQWVDNDRVLFLGGGGERGLDVGPGVYVLKLFHVSSRSTEEVEREVHNFCYVDGRLLLAFKQGRAVQYEPRTLDEPAPDRRFAIIDSRLDPLNCRVNPKGSPPGVDPTHHWKPLRDGDGLLDYGEIPKKAGMPPPTNLQHRSDDGRSVTPLDLTNNWLQQLAFVPFRREYFLYVSNGGRDLGDEHCVQPAHWFSPGQPVRHVEIAIPCFLLESAGISVFPSRVGYLIRFTGGAPLGGRSPTQGLHLAGGERAGRILAGFVGPLAVSPDGCKVAAVHADSTREVLFPRPRSTLKVLDLCALDGQSHTP